MADTQSLESVVHTSVGRATKVAVLGGGPAGLAAAWRLSHARKADVVVLEQAPHLGGNAGGFVLDGIPVDYGSHRLHPSCDPQVLADLRSLLGEDLLERPRHGRIRLRGRWIHFPLKPADLLIHLPWTFGAGVAADSLRKLLPRSRSSVTGTFAEVLRRGLGSTICRDFYFPYARKIWGVEPEQLSAAQAYRRVSAGSIGKMIRKVLGGKKAAKRTFLYPRGGFGEISSRLADAARSAGASIETAVRVKSVTPGDLVCVEVERAGQTESIAVDQLWSTIPLPALARLIRPAAPDAVREAAGALRTRAMVLVYLVIACPQFTEYDAHYFPGEDVRMTRLSEPKNYAGRSGPPDRTVLCAEVPCTVDDAVWTASDEQLRDWALAWLSKSGLPVDAAVVACQTRRLPHAYPIYEAGYERHLSVVADWVATLPNILSFGRQGLFVHDNTHHTVLMAYRAADCLDASGAFNRTRWHQHLKEFENHVVED